MTPSVASTLWKAARTVHSTRRLFHATSHRSDITKFQMPAMSPTMTEGGISEWKKSEGEVFAAGDVLLEIETDKATIDVEAQDDGIMGKIIAQNGTKGIPVGTIIALLAQQGDDISNLEVPQEDPKPDSSSLLPTSSLTSSTSASTPPPPPSKSQPSNLSSQKADLKHDQPIFPSVLRLLQENNVSDLEPIKGTGIRGMLTKGDVLAHLGKASSPNGSFRDTTPTPSVYKSQAVISGGSPSPPKPLDPAGIRNAILSAFLANSLRNRTPAPSTVRPTVDSVIADYLPRPPPRAKPASPPPTQPAKKDYLDGLY